MTGSQSTRETMPLVVPVSPGMYVQMQVPRPMTGVEWDQMWRVLDAMKPGIVEDPPTEPEAG
ncbi:MAG TPA: hypothetical protein VK453_25805 [Micromonosporaceae bacterium]|nr:hypothetical protein [Micromonosporaceae bacterium]